MNESLKILLGILKAIDRVICKLTALVLHGLYYACILAIGLTIGLYLIGMIKPYAWGDRHGIELMRLWHAQKTGYESKRDMRWQEKLDRLRKIANDNNYPENQIDLEVPSGEAEHSTRP